MQAAHSESAPEPVAAVVEVAAPTATPELVIRADRPTPLPSQYAFTHFFNEMADCYQQQGLPSSLESVEADIMVDVPVAVNAAHEAVRRQPVPGRGSLAPDSRPRGLDAPRRRRAPARPAPRPSHRNRPIPVPEPQRAFGLSMRKTIDLTLRGRHRPSCATTEAFP